MSIIKNNFAVYKRKRMPNMDRTGPNGAGPMTGRGQGKCGGPAAADLPRGRGIGGRFLRRGRGLGFWSRSHDNENRA